PLWFAQWSELSSRTISGPHAAAAKPIPKPATMVVRMCMSSSRAVGRSELDVERRTREMGREGGARLHPSSATLAQHGEIHGEHGHADGQDPEPDSGPG